jgi:hypothetical protein
MQHAKPSRLAGLSGKSRYLKATTVKIRYAVGLSADGCQVRLCRGPDVPILPEPTNTPPLPPNPRPMPDLLMSTPISASKICASAVSVSRNSSFWDALFWP